MCYVDGTERLTKKEDDHSLNTPALFHLGCVQLQPKGGPADWHPPGIVWPATKTPLVSNYGARTH